MIPEVEISPAPHAPAQAPNRGVSVPKRRRLGPVAAAVAACALAAAGGVFGWQTWLAPKDAPAKPPTETVQRGNIEDIVTATGTLQPRDYVDVGAQVSGQLKKLYVAVGSSVKSGDLLAEIDPAVYRARVDANQAQLKNLRAQLNAQQARVVLARQQLARQQNLMQENATSTDALQTAKATLDAAIAQAQSFEAQIEQNESELRAAEANLGYTKIYAPKAGTVVSVSAMEGQTLNANDQTPIVLRIADLSTMTVYAKVSEGDISKLREGTNVYFTTLGNGERRWNGKLRQIMPTPQVVSNVVLYEALFDVPNPKRELKTQMTAQVFFVVASVKDAVIVPVGALRPVDMEDSGASDKDSKADGDAYADPRALFANKRALVEVFNGEGEVKPREVRVGVVTRVAAQIVDGLEPGEEIVTSGQGGTKKSKKAKVNPRV